MIIRNAEYDREEENGEKNAVLYIFVVSVLFLILFDLFVGD